VAGEARGGTKAGRRADQGAGALLRKIAGRWPVGAPCGSLRPIMMRTAARMSLPLLLMACAACGSRPFAEGGSRELLVVTSLPADSPEILFLRAVLERPAIRIEDETAYLVRLASTDDRRVYRARTLFFVGYGRSIPEQLRPLDAIRAATRAPFVFSPDPWLRGQAAGLVWPERRD